MGKEMCGCRIYLAAYDWLDEDRILYAQNKGFGIIQPAPNGSDLTIDVKAEGGLC